MNRMEDLVNLGKFSEMIRKNKEEEKSRNCVLIIFAIIGAVAAIAAIAYGVYRYFTPDYLENFEDDFDDGFDDDFCLDDEDDLDEE